MLSKKNISRIKKPQALGILGISLVFMFILGATGSVENFKPLSYSSPPTQINSMTRNSVPKPSFTEERFSYEEQLLYDTGFDISEGSSPWLKTEEEDIRDVDGDLAGNGANFITNGDSGSYFFEADPTDPNWVEGKNPDFPTYPDSYGADDFGFEVSHDWQEDAAQSPSVHWSYNISLPTNLSDYRITDFDLNATVNGSVVAVGNGTNWGIDAPGDTDQFATYDYARFYVLLSDVPGDKSYEIAYYQTVTLVS